MTTLVNKFKTLPDKYQPVLTMVTYTTLYNIYNSHCSNKEVLTGLCFL